MKKSTNYGKTSLPPSRDIFQNEKNLEFERKKAEELKYCFDKLAIMESKRKYYLDTIDIMESKQIFENGEAQSTKIADSIPQVFPEIYDIVAEIKDVEQRIEEIKLHNSQLKRPSNRRVKIITLSMALLPIVLGSILFLPATTLAVSAALFAFSGFIIGINTVQRDKKKFEKKLISTAALEEKRSSLFIGLAQHIKNKFILSDKILDILHLRQILKPISSIPGYDPLEAMIKSLARECSTKKYSFSFDISTPLKENAQILELPVYSNSMYNILSDKNIARQLSFNSRDTWLTQQILSYYREHEFEHFYFCSGDNSLDIELYTHIFSIDKNWSEPELSNISSFIKEVESCYGCDASLGIIQSIKNNSKHSKRILKFLSEETPIKEVIIASKHLSPREETAHYKLKDFLNLCEDYAQQYTKHQNFSVVAKNLVQQISTINTHFLNSLAAEDKEIFDTLTKNDLPALMQNWKNLERLNANHSYKDNILDCLVDIEDKLKGIIENLQMRETQNIKVVKHMYSRK